MTQPEPLDAQILQTTALFKQLSEKDAHLATQGIELIKLAAGQELFHQGDAGDSMFFVVSGNLEVRLDVPGGGDRVVSEVGPNSILGEMSLLLEEPRTATVKAVTETELWKLSREKFQEAISWNERWANQFLLYMAQILARRLGAMNRELVLMMSTHKPSQTPADAQALENIFEHMFSNI